MDLAIYVALRVIHVACAATWFGITLSSASGVKRALARGVPEAREAVRIASRNGKTGGIMGLATFVTGLIIVFHMGGFAVATANIHAALALVLVMLGLSFFAFKPLAEKLETVTASPDFSTPSDQASGLVKRLSMLGGIQQLLWMVVLVLMFWRWT